MKTLLEANITHSEALLEFSELIEDKKQKIITSTPDKKHQKFKLSMLNDLAVSPLGRFFLEHQGANGFWTDYIINYPQTQDSEHGVDSEGNALTPTEKFIIYDAPVTLAHRERFKIFQRETQKRLTNGCTIASIPCGCMRDLITLDFSKVENVALVGVDLDSESLELASYIAKKRGVEKNVKLYQKNAWDIDFENCFDVINSSGLNVYEPSRKRVVELYKIFYKALKKGGTLITAVLTHPPGSSEEKSEWNLDKILSNNIDKERILFSEIVESAWLNFRSTDEMIKDFREAGFKDVKVIGDSGYIFPTIIATK